MNANYYVIVGDDYAKFSQQPNVFTVSELYKEMVDDKTWPGENASFIFGQGIGYTDREFIETSLKNRSVDKVYSFSPVATLADTHKHAEENVLITEPRRLGKLNYAFDLSLTDKIDRLSDHVTGQHVGAMLLMEAARQATIAVLEYEYCRNSSESFGLVLDRFDSRFDGYLFPLPASLNTVIKELKVSAKSITVVVTSTVIQCGVDIGSISLDVTLCNSRLLNKIESKKSQTAVKELCRRVDEALEQRLDIA
ncbi:AfsA-related hotdog domain-containing protein [Saccharophagus degradans]|uniref:A-factor biosynthesis hotdog domain-containing protein n=1 Tax=Saccharophagus degradans (strain 2-40 / ATCC 43961 / DSM 17024) TaxID=203122 RepID=Q21EY8_SACD2|nr:AfsA-related hotdog domain-containing protein [Saccharophagus degradans]ABD82741.1 hypothetical protein Sde_3486 [Saccharophagus degradans 2-40]